MNILQFGNRINTSMSMTEYLHKYIAETTILYYLCKEDTPSRIDVNVLDNGIEYIINNITDSLANRINAAVNSTPKMESYGREFLVRTRKDRDVFVINMISLDCI